MPSERARREGGAVALITVLVLMAVALAIVTGMNLLAISESSTTSLQVQSNRTFHGADACVEEALYRLTKNTAFTGGQVRAGGVFCDVTVGDLGSGRRQITACATDGTTGCTVPGRLKRRIQAMAQIATVTISGRPIQTISLTAWTELTQ